MSDEFESIVSQPELADLSNYQGQPCVVLIVPVEVASAVLAAKAALVDNQSPHALEYLTKFTYEIVENLEMQLERFQTIDLGKLYGAPVIVEAEDDDA
jgi:hypothetical protein